MAKVGKSEGEASFAEPRGNAASAMKKGHEARCPPPRLSGRYVIGQETLAKVRGDGRDAPIPAVRGTAIEPLDSTHNGRSALAAGTALHAPIRTLKGERQTGREEWKVVIILTSPRTLTGHPGIG